jgi:hypothetical protein
MATLKFGPTVPSKIQIGNEVVKEVWLGPIKLWPVVVGGVVSLGDYAVTVSAPGGGAVSFAMNPDGTTEGDAQGWFSPRPTPNVGAGKWAVLTDLGGGLIMSGASLGSRVELSSRREWIGTSVGGGVTKLRNFRLEVWNAAVGGTLLGVGSLALEVDGSN